MKCTKLHILSLLLSARRWPFICLRPWRAPVGSLSIHIWSKCYLGAMRTGYPYLSAARAKTEIRLPLSFDKNFVCD